MTGMASRLLLALAVLALGVLPLAACQRPANDGTTRGAYVGGSAGFNAR